MLLQETNKISLAALPKAAKYASKVCPNKVSTRDRTQEPTRPSKIQFFLARNPQGELQKVSKDGFQKPPDGQGNNTRWHLFRKPCLCNSLGRLNMSFGEESQRPGNPFCTMPSESAHLSFSVDVSSALHVFSDRRVQLRYDELSLWKLRLQLLCIGIKYHRKPAEGRLKTVSDFVS